MFSNKISTIIFDLKNNNKNSITQNLELIDLFVNGNENDKKLACLIILATDNRELNVLGDKENIIQLFTPILENLLLESEQHNELAYLIIRLYTNFSFYNGGKSSS